MYTESQDLSHQRFLAQSTMSDILFKKEGNEKDKNVLASGN